MITEARAHRWLFTLRLLARATPIRLAAYAVLALASTWLALGQSGGLNDFRDSHLINPYENVARSAVLDHGQVPLWDPYHCGGLYALGNAQTRYASPTFLLSLLFGVRKAEAVMLVLFLLLGMEGMYRYAKVRMGSALGPALAAPIFALCGYHSIGWALGWIIFFGFLLLPWLLWGTALMVRGRIFGLALVAGGFAVLTGFGGTYPVPLCALFVAFEALRGLLSRHGRRRWRISVPLLAGAALLSLGAATFKLWPIYETFAAAPRVMAGRPSHALQEILAMMFAISPPPPGDGGTRAIFFVGWALPFMAAGGIFTRRAIVPLLAGLFTMWLATGYMYPASAFGALRELPLFGALRYPYRFLIPGTALLAELAAVGVNALVWRARRGVRWLRPALAVCAIAVGGWIVQAVNFELISGRSELVAMPREVDQPFAQARGNRWMRTQVLANNRGSISCGEAYPVPMSDRLRGDLPAEEYLADPGAGSVTRVDWAPNRIDVEVKLARPATLLVNQNWHPGWRSSVGDVRSDEGLIGVDLPAGDARVTLRFLPRSGIGGMIVSALALLGVAAAILVARRRGPRTGALVALAAGVVSLVTLPAIAAIWEEPKQQPRVTNPDGAPIFADALPDDVTPVKITFGIPAEVVALKLPREADENGIVPMQLFWRVTGPVPRSVGIFVHVIAPDGTRKSGDHDLLAGSYFFRDAPRNQLIRDNFGAALDTSKPGTWKVYLGLWNAGGDGKRIPVFDGAGKRGENDSILLGEVTVRAAPPDAGTP